MRFLLCEKEFSKRHERKMKGFRSVKYECSTEKKDLFACVMFVSIGLAKMRKSHKSQFIVNAATWNFLFFNKKLFIKYCVNRNNLNFITFIKKAFQIQLCNEFSLLVCTLGTEGRKQLTWMGQNSRGFPLIAGTSRPNSASSV